jgi:hypothetical protein
MENLNEWFVSHNGYNYKYTITPVGIEDWEHIVRFICKWAKINEEFLQSDIKELINDLPNILDKITIDNKSYFIKIRVSNKEKLEFEKKAKSKNMDLSKYIKYKCLQ